MSIRRPAPWQILLGAAPVLIGAYCALVTAGILPGLQVALFVSANAVFALSALTMAWRRPAMRGILLLLAAAAASGAVADVLYYFQALINGSAPYPGVPDVYWLLVYPLMTAGLLLIVRRRTPAWDGASAIDAAIVAIGSGYLIFLFVIVSLIDFTSLTSLVALAYPVGDLMILVVGARLLLGAGRRTPALRLIGGYLVAMLITDTIYGFQTQTGTYQAGNFLDPMWMAGAFLFAAAILHPSSAHLIEPATTATPDATVGRLTVLALAAITAPTTTVIQHYRGAEEYVVASAAVCIVVFLLVMLRMALLVRAQRRDAVTDALTGLSTRRYFDQALGGTRGGAPVSLLLLDIDHFKTVNDTYGHHGGDRVLVEVTARLSALVRPGDVVARYGGEEFAVLLPDTHPTQARAVADRIRQAIADTPIAVSDTENIQVTISVGVADMQSVPSTEALITAADQALYAAKHAGRNRVATAPTHPSPSRPSTPTSV
ncbi:GGDEF domain-containing protein [Actinoplanes couchii]|uniref:GGDEF domain-containing protein n=1 Tax=Actinoplanes couchii TaxID=403638 RepID=A0ABQ3X0Z6_9ACTN|nr:GGDEF domain-containing protein [Actinoplanes couchii]MDR6316587.1 diguanylate cyclase (GGDEF)-like protein [Actinoplanes couchii]GID52201.1 hypothetical protein Aco03nite_006050 [Actinoplanes couchii]